MEITIQERRGMAAAPSVRPSISPAYGRRISWPALWAGAFAAMSIQVICGLLGVWASPLRPSLFGGQIPLAGISTGVGIWYLIYTIAAFALAGQVASRAAGTPDAAGQLQGFLTWSFATVIQLFALTIFASRNVVGIAGPVGNVVTAASAPGLTMVSPGWMFGGLLLGLLAALAGSRPTDEPWR